MKDHRCARRAVLLTSASFAGYNIGSGFATGIEALQFFGSWGAARACVGILIAAAVAAVVLGAVYVTGYEQQFDDSKKVYRYFCGKRVGVLFDGYIYLSMIVVTLTMLSGAGATISQYSGLPAYVGSVLMGVACVVTSFLGLEKLRKVLGYMCVLIVVLVFACGVYGAVTVDPSALWDTAAVEGYVASGRILRASAFGVINPYLSGLASAGLLIGSGFAWASATGTLCASKKEAVLSGVFSSVFFYAATAVVVYLLLLLMDRVAGKEVPMLAVIQYLLPGCSAAYSCVIILAIFSTISGRLFLIKERYGRGDPVRGAVLVTAITVFATAFAAIIPFSRLSNIMFSICGAVGIVLSAVVLLRFCLRKQPKAAASCPVEAEADEDPPR